MVLSVYYDSVFPESAKAWSRLSDHLDQFRQHMLKERQRERGLPEGFLTPLKVQQADVAPLQRQVGNVLGQVHPLPQLVLVDMRLPEMPGFEVLQWVRRQPGLARLPVVVITGMAAPEDAQRAQELGATAFLSKPFSFDQQVELARQIRDKWLKPVRQAGKG